MVLHLGVANVLDLKRTVVLDQLRNAMNSRLEEAHARLDPNTFWSQHLRRVCTQADSAAKTYQDFLEVLEDERKRFSGGFDYIVWNIRDQLLGSTIDVNGSESDWTEVSRLLRAYASGQRKRALDRLDFRKIRKVLGPHFLRESLDWSTESEMYLVHTDSTGKFLPFWHFFSGRATVFIRFTPPAFLGNLSVERFLAEHNLDSGNRFLLGMATQTAPVLPGLPQTSVDPEVKGSFEIQDKTVEAFRETSAFLCMYRFARSDLRLFAIAKKSECEPSTVPYRLLELLVTILSVPLLVFSFRVVVHGRPNTLSIRKKLAMLFFYANGLPLLVLGFLGHDFLTQKRLSLLSDAHQKGIAILRNFDEGLAYLYAQMEIKLQRFVKDFSRDVRYRILDKQANRPAVELADKLEMANYYIVASSGKLMASRDGVFKGDKPLGSQDRKREKAEARERSSDEGGEGKNAPGRPGKEYQILHIVCQRILGELNGEMTGGKGMAELEMIGESILQKPILEIIHSLFSVFGGISNWGLFNATSISFLDIFAVAERDKVDYLYLANWRDRKLQMSYVLERIATFNRNPLGLRVLAWPQGAPGVLPKGFPLTDSLRDYVGTLGPKPSADLETIEYRGQKFLALGFQAKDLWTFSLVGLYPFESVEDVLTSIRRTLWLFAVFSLAMTFLIARLLSQSFLNPVVHLTEAAHAIGQRRFSHRIPALSADEFGRMGLIFNHALVGLEELQVARIVQDSLFPGNQFALGSIGLFGRSVSMGELGGDYYDFFPIDENRLGFLIGDVAGHGVPAALIMAMAKAGVSQSRDLWRQPAALIQKLHQLILAVRSKSQRKVMTFQYACIDTVTGDVTLSNAGHCFPAWVRHGQGKVEEISVSGAPLGGFKKAVFEEFSWRLEPGEALVLFTDGIVETRNDRDEPLGYQGFHRLLLETFDPDPEAYFKKVYQAYLDYNGSRGAQDDLTLIVIVNKGQSMNPGGTPEAKVGQGSAS